MGKNNPLKIIVLVSIIYLIINFVFETVYYGMQLSRWWVYPELVVKLISKYFLYLTITSLPIILFLIFSLVCFKIKKHYWMLSISFLASCITFIIFVVWEGSALIESIFSLDSLIEVFENGINDALIIFIKPLLFVTLCVLSIWVVAFFSFDCILKFKYIKITRIMVIIQFVSTALFVLVVSLPLVILRIVDFQAMELLSRFSLWMMDVASLLPIIAYHVFLKFILETPGEETNSITA